MPKAATHCLAEQVKRTDDWTGATPSPPEKLARLFVLGKAHVHFPGPQLGNGRLNEGSWINFVTGLAIGKDAAYVATQSDGIYGFPLNGGPAWRIGSKQGLPADGVTALAMLDEKLYAGLANGYFIVCDGLGNNCAVLASSQRKE